MSQTNLYLLGSPHIERDGESVHVDTRKAIALLAYLAVSGIRHGRDSLSTLLWPESDSSNGRAALRRTLSALTKALQRQAIDADRDSTEFMRTEGIWLDVDLFGGHLASAREHAHEALETCLTCTQSLTEAVEVYRDDFLSGFTLRDSPGFDDWQFTQTEYFRRELAWALEQLVSAHTARQRYDTAINYARRWQSLDPLHEPVHQTLMRLYAWDNQRSAALRQYRDCLRILDHELGVAPLEETTHLYELIRENKLTATTPTADPILVRPPSGTIPVSSALPFVGRSAELKTMLDRYAQLGAESLVIGLEGEPGVGKTRLATEFSERIREQAATVLTARCREGESHLPYGPVIDLLRGALSLPASEEWLDAVARRSLAEAARLVPELQIARPDAEPLPPVDGLAAQTRLYEGVSDVILRLIDIMPGTVLFIDDLDWADTASQDLLAYLIRRLINRPVTVLTTWRTGGLPRGTVLMDLFAKGQGEGWMTIMPVRRLGHEHIVTLIETVDLPENTSRQSLADALFAETEGLPLFLAEYLKLVASRGPHEVGASQLPSTVQELLRARLATVSEIGRQLLTTAAAIGLSFDFDVLREASGRGEEETIIAVETLLTAGLIEEVSADTGDASLAYDFYHSQFRRLIYEDLSLARRRLLHRRIAQILARRAEHTRDHGLLLPQIAYHYEMARRDEHAANYYYLAGKHARAVHANHEALSYLNNALALEHPDAAGLQEQLGDLQTLLGEYAPALRNYEAAAAAGAPANLAALEHKIGQVYHRLGEWDLAESHYQEAIELVATSGSDVGAEARTTADWSLTSHRKGDTNLATDLALKALKLAATADDARALAQAHNILGILARNQQDTEQAKAHLQESLSIAESLGDLNAQVAAINNLSLVLGAEGNVEQALSLSETALKECEKLGDRHREAAIHSNLADFLYAAGRSDEAMTHLKRSAALLAEIGEPDTQRPEIWKLVEW